MKKTKFSIYVASLNSSTNNTCKKFEEACAEEFGSNRFEIKIVDILKDPASADEDRIIAIPTIIRKFPPPSRRTIGEISSLEDAQAALQYLINDL